MRYEVIHLKEHFPILGEAGKDPVLTVYVPDPMLDEDLKDRPRGCCLRYCRAVCRYVRSYG